MMPDSLAQVQHEDALLTELQIENQRADLCEALPEFWRQHINALCDTAISAIEDRRLIEALLDFVHDSPYSSRGENLIVRANAALSSRKKANR